ncbi:MAG TPA: hypothetical protein VFN56_01540 [Candidatus Saccharimonadales bacterium]|nr:hypothetical protein [Candidatus Saccharimonadales bacterium]
MKKLGERGGAETAVVLVIALIVGIAGGYFWGHSMKSASASTQPTASTKAADLRANLVTLGVEHMQLTDEAVDAALDGSKDANAKAAALYQNGNDIGAAVGSIYGSDAEKTFDSVWKLHLDQFVNYAVADSKGDTAGKQAALNAIDTGYTKPLAQYLAKANPNLPEATLETALSDHVQMTAAIIDAHVNGNYSDEQNQLKMASQHIEGIFSTLADGIVKQFPSKF